MQLSAFKTRKQRGSRDEPRLIEAEGEVAACFSEGDSNQTRGRAALANNFQCFSWAATEPDGKNNSDYFSQIIQFYYFEMLSGTCCMIISSGIFGIVP